MSLNLLRSKKILTNIWFLKGSVQNKFRKLGINKIQEICRLIYEIAKKEKINPILILKQIKEKDFHQIKEKLIKRRFPESYSFIERAKIYLPKLEINPQYSVSLKEFSLYPKYIYFEKDTSQSFLFKRFKREFSGAKFIEIESLKNYLKQQKYDLKKYNLRRETFFLVKERYDFFKSCPCSKNTINCHYYIFNLGFGCPYECVYCYLQEYANVGGIIFPTNLEDYFSKFAPTKIKFFSLGYKRIGTGEFTDSLAYDHISEYSISLVQYFKKYPKVYLELKTKSKNIKNLLKVKPSKNIVISWSLNPERIIKDCEFYTASLKERINSAKLCAEYGYSVGFHFDPIIYYSNWEKDYKEVISKIFKNIKEKDLAWISLGTFRFKPPLKKIIENRFPQTSLLDAELILDFDYKLRYPKYIRIKIYKKVHEFIRKYTKKVQVYLCMEDNAVWKELCK